MMTVKPLFTELIRKGDQDFSTRKIKNTWN